METIESLDVAEEQMIHSSLLRPEWRHHRKSWGHSLHPMCSYMAMFPARIPHYFIQKFTRKGDAVFDPFSGRGTTALQACVEGRIGIGTDLNPLAYLLTSAKVDPPTLDEVLTRLEELESDMFFSEAEEQPEDIRMLFHERTLGQLVYLKGMLQKDDRRDRFILATLTGALHGAPHKGKDTSSFLSISMPNTFSMSPNYIREYVKKHNLQKMPFDVFKVLRARIGRLYRHGIPQQRGYAYLANAKALSRIPSPLLRKKEVKLVVSSPPYLKVIRYGLYNWIRLWLIDEDAEQLDASLDQHPKIADYLRFMNEVCAQLYQVMAPGGVCALVIGDVKKPREAEPLNLAAETWRYLASKKTRFQLADIVEDVLPTNVKVTKIWGKEKQGNATLIDRVLVLYKDRYEIVNERVKW